jgi:hypothetical protein
MPKKLALAAALIGLFLASPNGLHAARRMRAAVVEDERDNDITVNPLGLAFGLGNITYERALSKENSWLAGVDFGSYGTSDDKLSIFGASGAYRWWFDKEKALNGWFAGPEVKIESVSWSFGVLGNNYSANGSFFGAGVQGGYQWVFRNGFTLNLGLNFDYLAGSIASNVTGAPALGFGGAGIGANLGLGYAF